MFSLVITIIAIALVAGLALATLYYGGNAFNKSSSAADNAKIVQEGNQIAGAFELYKADKGALPTGTVAEIKTEMVDAGYLKAWPDSTWNLKTDYAIKPVADEAQCLALNQSLGIQSATVPACSSITPGQSVCCSE